MIGESVMWRISKWCVAFVLLGGWQAQAQIVVPGADGSDGAFTPASSIQVDLSLAGTGAWDEPSPTPGFGVYDPDVWAVVFKYSEVNVAAGATVTFKNHPSRAPVVWLVDGDVIINGTVSLNGNSGHNYNVLHTLAEPGPGGFRGGSASLLGVVPTPGLGPGGAKYGDSHSSGGGGSYGTSGGTGGCGGGSAGPAYGSIGLLPLVGGSGGGPGRSWMSSHANDAGGGAGGGAILIASIGTVQITGGVRANGGNGGNNSHNGSGFCNEARAGDGGGAAGGAIRIVADTVAGTGFLRAIRGIGPNDGGEGGLGRIRVEANLIELIDQGSPPYTIGFPGETAVVFPPTLPTVRMTHIDGQAVPDDPRANLNFPTQDISMAESGPLAITLETKNVPTNWTVTVRIVPRGGGNSFSVNAAHVSGGFGTSTWEAEVTLPNGFSVMQARAFQP